jgi:hypothetical protein
VMSLHICKMQLNFWHYSCAQHSAVHNSREVRMIKANKLSFFYIFGLIWGE